MRFGEFAIARRVLLRVDLRGLLPLAEYTMGDAGHCIRQMGYAKRVATSSVSR